jgi:hypothetical protein
MPPRWTLIFSWWGFILAFLRFMKVSPLSPLLILIVNMLGTFLFLILKENIGPEVSLFILTTHIIPVYIFLGDTIDLPGSMVFFATYLLYLRLNKTSIQQVYNKVLADPMPTIGSYLSSRLNPT